MTEEDERTKRLAKLSKTAERLLAKPSDIGLKLGQADELIKAQAAGAPGMRSDQRVANAVIGAINAVPKILDSVSVRPQRFVKAYQALEERQDEELKKFEGKSAPTQGLQFVKNAVRDGYNVAASTFLLADALGKAADESPEAVSEFLADVPATIGAATYQVVSEPVDSFRVDPFGTVLTLTGMNRKMQEKLPGYTEKTIAAAPAPVARKMQQSLDYMNRKGDELLSIPIEDIGVVKRLTDDAPLSRSVKIVGDDAPRRRQDVPLGEPALTVRDVAKSALAPGVVGAGMFGLPGAIAGLAVGPAFRTAMSAARSSGRPNVLGSTAVAFERLVKQVSASQNVSDSVAKAHLLSQAAKQGSRLEAQLNKIENAIRSKDFDQAGFELQKLNDPVEVARYTTTLRKGPLGTKAEPVRETFRRVGEERRRVLPQDLREALDGALSILDETLGGRSEFVGPQIERIASFDNVAFLRSRAIKQGVLDEVSQSIGRKLKQPEIDLLISKMNQMHSLSRLSNRKIEGRVVIDGRNIDINNKAQVVLGRLPASAQRNAVLEATSFVMGRELQAVKAKTRLKALEDNALAVGRDSLYSRYSVGDETTGTSIPLIDALKEFDNLPSTNRPGSLRADVIRTYTKALADRVVFLGQTAPMAAPKGMTMNQIADTLNTPRFVDEFLSEAKAMGMPETRVRRALEDLRQKYQDGVTISDDAGFNLYKNDLDAIKKDVADARDRGLLDQRDLDYVNELFRDASLNDYIGSGLSGNKFHGIQVQKDFADTLNWLNRTPESGGKIARLLGTIGNRWKRTNTVLSGGTTVINNFGNSIIQSIEHGVLVPQIYAKYGNEFAFGLRYKAKNFKGMSDRDRALHQMTDDMGFETGDMTKAKAEMGNFIRASDVNAQLSKYGLDPIINKVDQYFTKNELANLIKEGAKSGGRGADKLYSMGDRIPKRVQAKASMRLALDAIQEMRPGDRLMIRTNRNVLRVIKRKSDGKWYYNNKEINPADSALMSKQNKPLRDALMAQGRRQANDRFVDFANRPGFMRLLDQTGLGGLLLDPFMTWALKMKGIGGPNIIGTIFGLNPPELIATNPQTAAKLNRIHANRRMRTAALMHSVKIDRNNEARNKFLDTLNPYLSSQSVGTVAASESPGMIYFRDLGALSPISEGARLAEAAMKLLASGDEEVAMKTTMEKGEGNQVLAQVISVLDVLGVAENPTVLKTIQDFMFSTTGNKRSRAARELRKLMLGRTGNDLLELFAGVLRDNDLLPEGIDALTPATYYDYINRTVPKTARQSRLRDFFSRNLGPIMAKQAQIFNELGPFGRPTQYERGMNRMKRHLVRQYYDPVVKRNASIEDRVKAWNDISTFFNKNLEESYRGYLRSVDARNKWDKSRWESWETAAGKLMMSPIPPGISERDIIQRGIFGE